MNKKRWGKTNEKQKTTEEKIQKAAEKEEEKAKNAEERAQKAKNLMSKKAGPKTRARQEVKKIEQLWQMCG